MELVEWAKSENEKEEICIVIARLCANLRALCVCVCVPKREKAGLEKRNAFCLVHVDGHYFFLLFILQGLDWKDRVLSSNELTLIQLLKFYFHPLIIIQLFDLGPCLW